MNKMLISATQADEVRVALVKGETLYDLDIEQPGFEQKKANIYKGKISRIEPSLAAAFVDYGSGRHGFLPFKDVARSYFKPELANEPFSRLKIKDALQEGQEIVVQIDKEERGNKGAALTTFISLAGSYLVLMPNNPRVGGVSRRVAGKERNDLKDILQNLNVPEGMGLIVRTAGVGKSTEELKWDLDSLLERWETIKTTIEGNSAPFLIHQEGDAVMRAIRDYLRQDMVEILVDSKELFEKTKKHIEQVKPDFTKKVKLYDNKTPLFSFYQIEKQIETAYQRVVKLPSGGSISIDHTEALVSIDINSARATGGSNIEETAFNTNLESADEIARQLRLRDIGGLIVIDFIDMTQPKHQREVSQRLREALEHDRARVQVGHITRFGLLEMSRQRIRTQLGSAIQITCPRCDGQGTIRSIESLSSSIIRLIEEEAIKEDTDEVQAQLPIDLATFILNERRQIIVELTKRQGVNITILPNQYLETPKHKIKRLRSTSSSKKKEASYSLIEQKQTDTIMQNSSAKTTKKTETKKVEEEKEKTGFIKKLLEKIFQKKPKKETKSLPEKPTAATSKKPYSPRKYNNRRRSPHKDKRRSSNNQNRKKYYKSKSVNPPPPPSDSYHEITAERMKNNVPPDLTKNEPSKGDN